jgi:hypothetical protein
MNPEERHLLERSLKLSEDNNRMLKKLERKAKWAFIWGFIKIAIVAVPIVIGFLFLQPYFEQISEMYRGLGELFNMSR